MPYLGRSPEIGFRTRYAYTATANQTSFSGTDDANQSLSYIDTMYIDVYLNGILLKHTDYTSTSGTAIVLDSGAAVNDILECVVYDVFSLADVVPASAGGTFAGNLALGTTLGVTGAATFSSTIDVTGTSNLDIVDIDGAVDMATTLAVAGNVDFNGDLDVDGTTNLDVVDIDGAVNMATTALVTGVLTTTATQVATGGITSGSDIVSDTDSTDDLGTTSVRWANLFVDAITATDQITATGFTGTLDGILGSGAAAAATVTTLTATGASTHGSVATEHGAGAIATSFAPITRRSTSNGVITTKIHFDLTGLGGKGGAANDVIGLPAGGNAFIGRNVVSSNGIVYKAELACLELAAAASGSATVDIDIATNASGTIAYDGAGGTAKLFNTGGMVAGQELSNITPALTANDYFYLVEADTAATDGVYNAGQFVLTLYGHAVT